MNNNIIINNQTYIKGYFISNFKIKWLMIRAHGREKQMLVSMFYKVRVWFVCVFDWLVSCLIGFGFGFGFSFGFGFGFGFG